ncbi:unnamed protein product [Jaminaea pallidilutea]
MIRSGLSQSFQTAPFNKWYRYNEEDSTWFDTSRARPNSYRGGRYQQTLSGVCHGELSNYELSDGEYQQHAVEYRPGHKDSYISWAVAGKKAWSVDIDKALKADP